MRRTIRSRTALAAVALAGLLAGTQATAFASAPAQAVVAATSTRVAVWATGVNPGGAGFTNRTIRQVIHSSVGGTSPRLRLSNLFSSGTLTAGHVDLAVQGSGGAAVAGSHHAVRFGGSGSVTVAKGAERWSDPVTMTVTAGQNLLVSIYVSSAVTSSTQHPSATATTWVSSPGDRAADDGTGNYPTTNTSWFFLSGLDAVSTTATGTVVAFGDSITDGYRSTRNADHRYPDYLARRLVQTTGGPRLSVVNAGIGGNQVLRDAGNTFGYSALNRFARDALGQTGVRDVVLLEGINDITSNSSLTVGQLTGAYRALIDRAHAAGVAVYGGTLTPFNLTGAQESLRLSVNTWIRTAGAFDGVVDFDAALRDPANPAKLRAAYDSGDHGHPSDAGYQAMAAAIDLALLKS